jgi:transposase-like protein
MDEKLIAEAMELLRPRMESEMAEALKEARRRLIAEFTQKPPPAVAPKAPRRRPALASIEKQERDWSKVMKTCPRCETTKPVDTGFGVTKERNGGQRAQSWCLECRANTNYHDSPRKYRGRGAV